MHRFATHCTAEMPGSSVQSMAFSSPGPKLKEIGNQWSVQMHLRVSNRLTATTRVNPIGIKTLPSESMLDRSTRPTCLTFRRASHVARRNVEGNFPTLPPTGRSGNGGRPYAGENEASFIGTSVCCNLDGDWMDRIHLV